LNVTATIGNQSMMLSISRLLLDTTYREEHYLKTLLAQRHFLFSDCHARMVWLHVLRHST